MTKQTAELIGQLADGMRVRDIPAPQAAHFLMKLVFCMCAEDIGLLPGKVLSRVMETATKGPDARRGSPDPAETADRKVSDMTGRPAVEPAARSGDRPQPLADAGVIELTAGEILKLATATK